jgi:hypothetical protein
MDFHGLAIGRVVHYVFSLGEHRPAIVTRVVDKKVGLVNLNVLRDYEDIYGSVGVNDSGYMVTNVYPSETYPMRTWHWPERED